MNIITMEGACIGIHGVPSLVSPDGSVANFSWLRLYRDGRIEAGKHPDLPRDCRVVQHVRNEVLERWLIDQLEMASTEIRCAIERLQMRLHDVPEKEPKP
jgi:hypothetical protein